MQSRSALALIALLVLPSVGGAQVRASEPASVSQTVDGTSITVEYSRPRARGRTGIFGSRIHVGEVWTPGANQATTMALGNDATINNHPVPKGKYSVWFVTDRDDWTMVLDPDSMRFHTNRPTESPGQIRFPVTREKRPFMEVLTFWFPEVRAGGATLALQWDTVFVPMKVDVTPSYTTVVAADVAKRLAGRYRLQFAPMPSDPSSSDEEQFPESVTFTITPQNNELRAVMDPPMFTTETGYRDWVLIPRKGGWYWLGRYDNGEMIDILDFLQVEFDASGDRAGTFEVRLPNDMVMGTGTRLP